MAYSAATRRFSDGLPALASSQLNDALDNLNGDASATTVIEAGRSSPDTLANRLAAKPNADGGTFTSPIIRFARIGVEGDVYQVLASNYTYGSGVTAVAMAVTGNQPGAAPQVMGGISTSTAVLGGYPTEDSVALYVSNAGAPPAFTVTNVTYDASHAYFATPLTAAQIAAIQPGMLVKASGAGAPYRAVVASVASDGTSLTTNPLGWIQRGDSAASVPPAGSLMVNPVTKVFGANLPVFLTPASLAPQAVGLELDLFNNTAGYVDATDTPSMGGIDIPQLGGANTSYGFRARGPIRVGFNASTGGRACFLADPAGIDPTNNQVGPDANPSVGSFVSYQTSGDVLVAQPATIAYATVQSRVGAGATQLPLTAAPGAVIGAVVCASPYISPGTTILAVSGSTITLSAPTNGVLLPGVNLALISVGAKTVRLTSAGSAALTGMLSQAPSPGLAAAGSTQATAVPLTAAYNAVLTTPPGTGVVLKGSVGTEQIVFNLGANALLVYPPANASIDAAAVNTPASVAVGGRGRFVIYSSAQVFSA